MRPARSSYSWRAERPLGCGPRSGRDGDPARPHVHLDRGRGAADHAARHLAAALEEDHIGERRPWRDGHGDGEDERPPPYRKTLNLLRVRVRIRPTNGIPMLIAMRPSPRRRRPPRAAGRPGLRLAHRRRQGAVPPRGRRRAHAGGAGRHHRLAAARRCARASGRTRPTSRPSTRRAPRSTWGPPSKSTSGTPTRTTWPPTGSTGSSASGWCR